MSSNQVIRVKKRVKKRLKSSVYFSSIWTIISRKWKLIGSLLFSILVVIFVSPYYYNHSLPPESPKIHKGDDKHHHPYFWIPPEPQGTTNFSEYTVPEFSKGYDNHESGIPPESQETSKMSSDIVLEQPKGKDNHYPLASESVGTNNINQQPSNDNNIHHFQESGIPMESTVTSKFSSYANGVPVLSSEE